MTVEKIKQLKRDMVLYGEEYSSVEDGPETLLVEDGNIIYIYDEYREGLHVFGTAMIESNKKFLKKPCAEIISSINEAYFYCVEEKSYE